MATFTMGDLIDTIGRFALLPAEQFAQLHLLSTELPDVKALADELIGREWLTPYQCELLLDGRGQDLVHDQYVMLNLLGQGSMGMVFKARQRRLARIVALKVIREDVLVLPAAVERFHREAHAAGRLSHPNVVTVFDTNHVGSTHYLAMELLDGPDLARLVKEQGPLPVGHACDYIRQAALGLQHVHEQGLIHRDIKPGNLMLARQGTVKLMDLGLARFSSDVQSSGSLTSTGEILGTVGYMSPEQISDAKRVDIRADIYSLGSSLYHLLTGKLPFTGSLTEITRKHRRGEVTPISMLRPEVSETVSVIVQKMMAYRPEERYTIPAEVANELGPFSVGTSGTKATMKDAPGETKATMKDAAGGTPVSGPPEGDTVRLPPS